MRTKRKIFFRPILFVSPLCACPMRKISLTPSEKREWKSGFTLQLHGAIYRPDSFVFMLRYCVNLKAIRYESTTLKGIVADKSHRVIVA